MYVFHIVDQSLLLSEPASDPAIATNGLPADLGSETEQGDSDEEQTSSQGTDLLQGASHITQQDGACCSLMNAGKINASTFRLCTYVHSQSESSH